MQLTEAILQRRTIKEFKTDAVSTEVLQKALNAGIWAQNHRMTQPWRFSILGPQTHQQLAMLAGEVQYQSLPAGSDDSQKVKVRLAAEQKLLSKPRLVAVRCLRSSDANQAREDYAAVACAIQNIQLAAWEEGLGMQWSTSKLIQHPQTYEILNVDAEHEEIVGLLYFGYPASIPAPLPRKPLAEVYVELP